jgi:hypothetical protein
MSVPDPWLATLVEQCLGSYADQSQSDGMEVEDNGTTVCFRRRDLTPVAAVFEVCFPFVERRDVARLTVRSI